MRTSGYFLVKKGPSNQAFELRGLDLEALKDNQVLIEAEGFGLNYADVMARKGLYKGAPPMPCVIGYEVVGKVVGCAEKADQALLGKRVLAFCRFGGYARHVITTDIACVPVENQPMEELMALCTQAVTAYYMAAYLAPVHPNDTVLVHAAAGGVGTILIQLSKHFGATVIAKVGQKEKENLVQELGADFVVNYNTSDYSEQIKQRINRKVDVSFNPVGGSTYKKDLALMRAGGRMVLFGGSELGTGSGGFFSKLRFVYKMGVAIPAFLMMKSRSILGVNMLEIADERPEILEECLNSVIKLYQQGVLVPQVGAVFTDEELPKAHDLLASGNSTGKISVRWRVA